MSLILFFIIFHYVEFFDTIRYGTGNIVIVRAEVIKIKHLTRIFHKLLDAIENVNSTYTFHLISTIFMMSIVDIFISFSFLSDFLPWLLKKSKYSNYVNIIYNFGYCLIQFILKTLVAHIGHKTTQSSEDTKALMSRHLNILDDMNHVDKSLLFNALIQYQTRKIQFSNIFFNIDWVILVKVGNIEEKSRHGNFKISRKSLKKYSKQ